MFKNNWSRLLGCVLLTSGAAQSADSIWDAMKEGKPTVQLRLRYESVKHDSGFATTTDLEKSDGLFVRTAIGYKTGSYMGFSAYAQLEDISVIGNHDYTGTSGQSILDPESADLNMSYIEYNNKDNGFMARLGRQTIIYDNARHIGNVGWRMNDQTYDAATVKYSNEGLEINYNYIWMVNRITAIEDDSDIHLANVSYKFTPGKLTGYYYKLDFEPTNPGFGNAVDSDTIGARFTGKTANFLYTLEYAKQEDGADNATKFDADYMLAELGYDFKVVTVKAGYEELGSDNGTASFSTPLATVHAHNGWSDRTLSLTPGANANGIQDTYFSIDGKVAGVKLLAAYHMLETDNGGTDIGDEINLLAVYKTKAGPVIGAKAAMFDSSTSNNDTEKFWVWTEYKF